MEEGFIMFWVYTIGRFDLDWKIREVKFEFRYGGVGIGLSRWRG